MRFRPVLSLALLTLSSGAWAEVKQDYIDLLKEGLPPEQQGPRNDQGYTARKRQELGAKEQGSFIESVKASDPGYFAPASQDSLIQSEKARLGAKKEESAIGAVHAGKSELEPNIEGEAKNAIGFRIAAAASRDITAPGGSLKSFQEVYDPTFVPDLTIFYEYQALRHPTVGKLGAFFSLGASYYSGQGQFEHGLTNPVSGQPFGADSSTRFHFLVVPITLGGKYTFTAFRYLNPYVYAGPTWVGYLETRSDNKDGNRGSSRAVLMGAGANINTDLFSRKTSWQNYVDYSIKKVFITLDFSRLATFSGDVDFSVSSVSAGLTYEF